MTFRLKIEILKVFSLDLEFSSDKIKKEEKDAKKSDDAAPATKPK